MPALTTSSCGRAGTGWARKGAAGLAVPWDAQEQTRLKDASVGAARQTAE